MKKSIKRILIVIVFLAGLSLLLYPFVANQWNNYRQKRLISSYEQVVAEKEKAGEIDYQAEKEAAVNYNKALSPSILPDSFAIAEASEEDEAYMSCLNIAGDSIMGTVEIPKINITLPIYHTTSDEVLQVAAGHLEGSTLPVGGEDTHAVISAHRGLPSAALFTDLDKLEETDHFLLHVLDETLCYEVDKISVIEPKDTSDLAIEKGKDLVTLMTCTPYGVNSHRLLVRGHRVPYVEEELADETLPLSNMSLHTSYLLWVVVGLAIAAAFSFFLYKREKKLARGKAKGTGGSVDQTEISPTQSEEPNGEELPPEESKPEETSPEESKPEETPPEEASPEESEPEELPSEETGPEDSPSGESEPDSDSEPPKKEQP